MSTERSLKAIAAGALVSLMLVGCGGGSSSGTTGPSALDPANMVPSSAALYASITIRPQGSVGSNLIHAVDRIAGAGTAERLRSELDKQLASKSGKQFSTLKQWLGQRVGVALVGLPVNLTSTTDAQLFLDDLLIVAPTSDPSAARRQLAGQTSVPSGMTDKVIGHYVILGGQYAVQQALATTAKTSLASSAPYRADMAGLGSGGLFSFYASAHALLGALLPAIRARGQVTPAQLAAAQKAAPPGSSVALGLATTANQFRIDFLENGMPKSTSSPAGAATDVSSLPSGSWLALALAGGLANKAALSSLPQAIARLQAATAATGQAPTPALQFIERDLLPALGPMSLSISGTSRQTLKAGLVISPLNRAAGGHLAGGLRQLLSGKPITATTVGSRVLVLFGYKDAQQLLHPSASLADDPTFKSAESSLPAGSKADMYLNFGPVALLGLLDHNASDAKVWKVARRLKYLIAGGTHGHFRLVLATN